MPAAPTDDSTVRLAAPRPSDGLGLHALARLAGGLDVNSPYSYHLWCRDFSATSTVARADGAVVGFVTGYRRPGASDRLFVWQVAVDPRWRGRGLGVAMLRELWSRAGCPRIVEATVTPSNEASRRMFERFAAEQGGRVVDRPFLGAEQFPDAHEPELLLELGPFVTGETERTADLTWPRSPRHDRDTTETRQTRQTRESR